MNPNYLGDSYDIVKRYFCEAMRLLGYHVYVDPMPTGDWCGQIDMFLRFLNARSHTELTKQPAALFLDPDTGVRSGKETEFHTSLQRVASECMRYDLVFAFDQSFSRSSPPRLQMDAKLSALAKLGCFGMYYDSHARVLFASRNSERIVQLSKLLVDQGLPAQRLLAVG
jgi:hypothetical protein